MFTHRFLLQWNWFINKSRIRILLEFDTLNYVLITCWESFFKYHFEEWARSLSEILLKTLTQMVYRAIYNSTSFCFIWASGASGVVDLKIVVHKTGSPDPTQITKAGILTAITHQNYFIYTHTHTHCKL